MDTIEGFVWLEFPDHGGKQQFPAAAVPIWKARGWRPCDPPPEPNLIKDPLLDDPQPKQTPVPPVDVPVADTEPGGPEFDTDQPDAGTDTSPQEA